ncbi:MAG: glycosyltransferase family 39 protein [Elusimicrobia bacterium]|nr:glycosyltransferase family 39 protein [Elusimicrobiota bacterium]
MRLFSALCGLASLGAFYALCQRLDLGRSLLPISLACLSSFWIHLSQDGRTYSLLLLIVLLATCQLLALERRWSMRRGLAYAALSAAGLYTHNFYAFFLAANMAYICFEHRRMPRLLRPWGVLWLLIASAYLPWLSSLSSQVRNWAAISALQQPFDLGQLAYLFGNMAADTGFLGFIHQGWTKALGAAVATSLALSAWRRPPEPGQRRAWSLCCFHLLLPLALAWSLETALGQPLTQTRYFTSISPFLYIMAAMAIDGAGRWAGVARALAIAVVLAGAAAYAASGAYLDPRLARLSAAIDASMDRRLPLVHLDPYYYTPMRYYYLAHRPHFLTPREDKKLNWAAVPGYPAVLSGPRLDSLGPCLMIDPGREFFDSRYGSATGQTISRVLFPSSQKTR